MIMILSINSDLCFDSSRWKQIQWDGGESERQTDIYWRDWVTTTRCVVCRMVTLSNELRLMVLLLLREFFFTFVPRMSASFSDRTEYARIRIWYLGLPVVSRVEILTLPETNRRKYAEREGEGEIEHKHSILLAVSSFDFVSELTVIR